jgi:hypothetical protein
MLKKPASGVLAALSGSTYRSEYASPFRWLRPCRSAFLSILRCPPANRVQILPPLVSPGQFFR